MNSSVYYPVHEYIHEDLCETSNITINKHVCKHYVKKAFIEFKLKFDLHIIELYSQAIVEFFMSRTRIIHYRFLREWSLRAKIEYQIFYSSRGRVPLKAQIELEAKSV